MKIGIIRCAQTEDICPMTTCLKVAARKKGAFADIAEEIEVVGANTCGGCPGKRAVTRAANMVKNGADTIALSSCITKGSPIGFPCPHREQMERAIREKLGDGIQVLTYTHD